MTQQEVRERNKIARKKYYASHKEKCNEYGRNYYALHKDEINQHREEIRESRLAQGRKYDSLHREKRKAYEKKWYLLNHKEHFTNVMEWRKNNPEIWAEIVARRYARERGAKGSHTAEEWFLLKHLYGNKCLACGKTEVRLTRDHIIPLILNGTDEISNIQPLCKSCNSRKSAKIIDYRPARYLDITP